MKDNRGVNMDDKIVAIVAITVLCCFGVCVVKTGAAIMVASGISAIAGLAGYSAAKNKGGTK